MNGLPEKIMIVRTYYIMLTVDDKEQMLKTVAKSNEVTNRNLRRFFFLINQHNFLFTLTHNALRKIR